MNTYLGIGLYEDDNTRFASSYEAESPEDAEQLATTGHPGLVVAGVINEEGQVAAR
jgi:hypothetical protein